MAYTPAGNTTGSASLAHLASVFYRKRGLDRLQKKFQFRQALTDDVLPKMSGRTIQWFRYSNLASSSTPTTEGAVGTSQSMTSKIVSATVSQYTSFITVSDLLQDTAIDPIVQNASELLGYQGGLTVDTITRTVIDGVYAGCTLTAQGTYLKVADLRNARSQLQAVDVEPMSDGNFLAIAHPFSTYDIVNDPAAGGLADIRKYTNPAVLNTYQDRGEITVVAGCRLIESTNVLITAGSPNTYAMYVFGKDGVGGVDLEGRGPNKVVDPKKQRFKINVIPGDLSVANPEGTIGAAVSYNFLYAVAVLEGPTGIGGSYRLREFRTASSIG
jgi:N4-gp56 family major capsid protein